MTSGIYQLRNLVNGKIYIGSAASGLKRRKNKHWFRFRHGIHHNRYLQNAWNMYGEDAFAFEVLVICHPTMCLWYEQQFIDQWQPEYNLCPVAGNTLGRKSDPDIRRRVGLARRGYRHTETAKLKMSQAKMGHTVSAETRRKIGATNARPYPAFVDPDGSTYPPGVNLWAFCQEHELCAGNMYHVAKQQRRSCQGWRLAS